MYFLAIVFTFSRLTHLPVLIYLILHDLILNVSYYLYTSKQRYVLFLYYVQTYALFIFFQHPSPHILTSTFARACLKNHFRKLRLAAHEKPFSDTL